MEQQIEEWRQALDLIDQTTAYYVAWDRQKKRPPPLSHLPAKAKRSGKRR